MSSLLAQASATALDTAFPSEFPAWQSEFLSQTGPSTASSTPKLIAIDKHPDAGVQRCSDNRRIGNRMLHKHVVVGQPYPDEVSDGIDERLAMAGLRLAMISNDAAENLD